MPKATTILSQPTLDTFRPISAQAVFILARLAAKNAVKAQLRDEGRRLSLVFPAEINQRAAAYLALHQTELFAEARERAQRLRLFDKPKRRRR